MTIGEQLDRVIHRGHTSQTNFSGQADLTHMLTLLPPAMA